MFLSPLLWIDLISDEKRPLFIRRANFFFLHRGIFSVDQNDPNKKRSIRAKLCENEFDCEIAQYC